LNAGRGVTLNTKEANMPSFTASESIPDTHSSFLSLPFVYRAEDDPSRNSNWHVPPTSDYAHASQIGRDYTAYFVHYLKDHDDGFGVNALGYIVKDIDFSDESGTKGYWVGFFSYLERLLQAQAKTMDVFADVVHVDASLAG
jgi:hypothetical protein